MPMFEFTCTQCNQSFEELVFTMDDIDDKVSCPACHSNQVQKKLSAFSVGTSGMTGQSANFSDYGGGCSTGSCCPGGSCGF